MLVSQESPGGDKTFPWQLIFTKPIQRASVAQKKRAEGLQQPDTGFSGHQAFRGWKVPKVGGCGGTFWGRHTHVRYHKGLPEPLNLRREPPQPSIPVMPIAAGLVPGAMLMGAVVVFLIWKRRSRGLD